jgi:uncharacterized protein YjbI with pentapeptide repeats
MANPCSRSQLDYLIGLSKRLLFFVFVICLSGTVISGIAQNRPRVLYPVKSKNLARADLSGHNLRDLDLEGANLEGANLRNTDLKGSNLRGANLRNANLQGASLKKTDLRNAILAGANFREANFREADIAGADFQNSKWCDTITFDGNMLRQDCQDKL